MLGYTHTVSHTQICSDTLTWMYVVTQTHSKAHTHNFTYTQFYIHMCSYTDTHPCAYTVTHNCIHTYTLTASTHTCLCGYGARQQALSTMPQLWSADAPAQSAVPRCHHHGGWMDTTKHPSPILSSCGFCSITLPPVTIPRKQGCGRETEGRAPVPALLGAQAPDQECWSTLRLHFPVCR